MKSKSYELKPSSAEKHTRDKTLDFVGLYKSVAETNKVAEKRRSDEIVNNETTKAKTGAHKRERTPNKNKNRSKQEPVDISQINIDGANLSTSVQRSSTADAFKVTSTPNTSGKNQGQTGRVKSIMKGKPPTEQSIESARSNTPSAKPKKRNKSVSFMLDDNEEVMVKRTKSDDSNVNKKPEITAKPNIKDKSKNFKKFKKYQQSEKENKAAEVNNQNMDVEASKSSSLEKEKKTAKFNKTKKMHVETPSGDAKTQAHDLKEKKRNLKKSKNQNLNQVQNPQIRKTTIMRLHQKPKAKKS